MKKTKLNKKQIMPKDEDIRKMSSSLIELMKNLMEKMEEGGPNPKDGLELISVCLVYFIMFNRKRAGEVKWILLTDFQAAKKADMKLDEEMVSQLDKLERKIAQRHLLMKLTGKIIIILDTVNVSVKSI